MKYVLDIVRGAVIGLANIIPGVSGGTMMVSMGIYDTLIDCINHLFSQFKKSVRTLLPYAIGMLAAIVLGAFALKKAFSAYPLPTNALFIGLILGSVPMIMAQMKGEKKGFAGAAAFVLFFALVVVLKLIEAERSNAIVLDFGMIIKLFLMGCMCSAAMVVPGVSGSMLLKTLGYYEPVVTVAIPDLVHGLTGGDWAAVGHNVGILLPFGIGIIVGIFAVAKLLGVLLAKWKGITYCGILGMVAASPVAILLEKSLYTKVVTITEATETAAAVTGTVSTVTPVIIIVSVVCLAAGVFIALRLGGDPEKK